MTIIIVNILGWVGSLLLIAAYYLNSKNWFTAQSFEYQLLNLIGSVCLIVNTVYFGAYPSAAVNVIWVFIGAYYLMNNKKKHERKVC